MSKRKPITVDGVTYNPLELEEGDVVPDGAYFFLRAVPTLSQMIGCKAGGACKGKYYTKAKTVILQGVEYAILGPSDGTDYGYQPGDGFRCVSGTFSWLRPVTKAAEVAEPTVTIELTVAEAENHLDILYRHGLTPKMRTALEQVLWPHRDSERAKELEDKIAELQKELDKLRGDDQ